jgi:hypothetical protein
MKTKLLIIILTLTCVCTAAFADDETYVVVACRDSNEKLADAGYLLSITKGGVTGGILATVKEQSLVGPRVLETIIVKEKEQGMDRVFTGDNFELVIAMESIVPTDTHPAKMYFVQKQEDFTRFHIADLICTVIDKEII